MAGLIHEFLLLSHREHPFSDYAQFHGSPHAVRLHDDMIGYMFDTLEWIPSFNPARNEHRHGLCRHGVTVIHTEGAPRAVDVLNAWADLFSAGPDVLRLTGDWTTVEGGRWGEGDYDQLQFGRDDVVRSLRQLVGCLEQVVATGGEHYVLHIGI